MTLTLNVFISSKMIELKEERDALFALLSTLDYGDIKLHGWLFEEDALADEAAIRKVYLDALKEADLYLGLFWKRYGVWTIDEFEHAGYWGVERHVYVKDVDVNNPADPRDPELRDFLNRIGDVPTGITTKWFKTTDELCDSVKRRLDKWVEDYRSGPRGESSAWVYEKASEIQERAEKLIGRDDLITQAKTLLEEHKQVLLQGFSGSGKTALAAELATQYTPVLWLRAGRNKSDEVLEALARPFGAHKVIAKQSGDNKYRAMHAILSDSGIKLLVIDDAWNGRALAEIIRAVPHDIPLIVTSRHIYNIRKSLKVDNLSPDAALQLVNFHSDRDLNNDLEASTLCRILGYLPFSVRIAGINLKMYGWKPAELIQKIADEPHDLTIPLGNIERGRESIAKLLQVSLNALEEDVRELFLSFGAFFTPQLTLEMLSLYLADKPTISAEQVEEIRINGSEFASVSDDELKFRYQVFLVQNLDTDSIEKLLNILYAHGLLERVIGIDNRLSNLQLKPSYRIHDLAFSYVKKRSTNEQSKRAVEACLFYSELHKKASAGNFSALIPELDNLIACITFALSKDYFREGEYIAQNLLVGEQSGGILSYLGYLSETIRLLPIVAEAAKRSGNIKSYGVHLGNLGSHYRMIGLYAKCVEFTEEALSIAIKVDDNQNKGAWLGTLGIVCRDMGFYEKSKDYFDQTLEHSQKFKNFRLEGSTLGNLSSLYNELGKFPEAIEYATKGLAISKRIGYKRVESTCIAELGMAYTALGELSIGIELCKQAVEIARNEEDIYRLSHYLANLGTAYFFGNEISKAEKTYEEALEIARRVDDFRHIGKCLHDLGNIYSSMGQTTRALKNYELAREIFTQIQASPMVKMVDMNISTVRKPELD